MDIETIECIEEIIKGHPNSYGNLIQQSNCYEELRNRIDECINEKYKNHRTLIDTNNLTMTEKIYLIRHEIEDVIEVCPECGKLFVSRLRESRRKRLYCSKRCGFISKDTKIKRGITNENKYGVDCVLKSRYHREIGKKTSMDRYGVEIPMRNECVKNKMRKTIIEKYGVDNVSKDEWVKRKKRDTCNNNYGVEYSFQSDKIRKKMKKTIIEKYGFDNVSKNEEIKEKKRNSCIEHYGTDHPMHVESIRKRMHKRYEYNGISFDSTPEIALYIFLSDYEIDFEYQPEVDFMYIENGIMRKYYPDFKIGNEYIEIKGEQFFDDNDNLINPYTKNRNYEKEMCMKNNGVRIMRYDEYKIYLKYVNRKYGRKYMKQFKKLKCDK